MRVAIPHNLDKAEVRRRLRERSGEIADHIPGGMAHVTTNWRSEDEMAMSVAALGQSVDGSVLVEDQQVVFVVTLPPALSFFEPIVAGAIRDKGVKLLT
ncbi:hypothetical protein GRI38_13095 [Altererythrobacter aurantiacus]|uniref:Polyhydroxyalkanoic acid system protein (PHA_gran_rgn) n=1 Tax=Parapontixanthobacter aurantiacus TaxID=1463599 RepID=A0A844ZHD2_9SPHN|nr:polyhydroxyalkanoic acid system family protein [Parapontixanthobacter aurantiacus]MXO86964.1 hypothetical protein [Parapontixanthobacter aurantiacus]